MAFDLTILYDNQSRDAALTPDWGFAALVVNSRGDRVLFDTGANGAILEHNAAALGFSLDDVSHVVISHWHWDHTGGLDTVLQHAPEATYHLPSGVGGVPTGTAIETVGSLPAKVADGVYSTGVLNRTEQGLVLLTDKGSFLVTGCAHPGVEAMLEAAAVLAPPFGLIGGLHGFSRLERLEGLSSIYPCHCTQRTGEILKRYPDTASRCAVGFRLKLA
jgi:7,8-dihydropterin-6-yl-methyl-4-(beta-D-ribofuranosyl)aminobenzene 5'-phosphate synthase